MSKKELLFIAIIVIFSSTILGLYFSVFNGKLSTNVSDWGSFGSYLAGAVTLPFSLLSLYFIYKTYKKTEQSYQLEVYKKDLDIAHESIKEASVFLEDSLNQSVIVAIDEYEKKEVTFRDINFNPNYAKALLQEVKTDKILKGAYRISVGKPFLCLYDFLTKAELNFGETETIRLYKIRHQWIISLHNAYNLNIIKGIKNGPSSKEIENYFYSENRI